MAKYLRKFANSTAYNTAKSGSNFWLPCTSLIDDTKAIIYDPYDVPAAVGDYLFSDLTFSSTLSHGKTAIGLCVAPAAHFTNHKARWMSLVNMSATDPEHGTTATGTSPSNNPGAGFCWGASGSITGLNESNEVSTLVCEDVNQPTIELSKNTVGWGYVPSDYSFSSSVTYPLNSSYNYYGEDGDMDGSECGAIPSPFNQDGSLNQWARLNALQYEGGKAQTTTIMGEASKYSTGTITRNDAEPGSYPAATACNRFYTSGTQAGDWYLPSITELMYVGVNLDLINTKLNGLGNAAVKVGDYETSDTFGYWLWSSSAYSSDDAWHLITYRCYLGDRSRLNNDTTGRIRAFLEL